MELELNNNLIIASITCFIIAAVIFVIYRKKRKKVEKKGLVNIEDYPSVMITSLSKDGRPYTETMLVKSDIPNRIVSGSGKNVSVILLRPSVSEQADRYHNVYKFFVGTDGKKALFEAEIQLAGAKVVGDIKQTVSSTNFRSDFYWNICFEKAGIYEVRFVLRHLKPEENIFNEIKVINKKVVVTDPSFLASKVFALCAYIAATTGFILAVLQILQILGYIPTPK